MADTIPRVTVGSPPRLSALPMAITSSPTWRSSDEPSSAGTRSSTSCTWITARSSSGELPDERGGVLAAVGQHDGDVADAADHVGVGEHEAVGAEDDARAGALEGALLAWCRWSRRRRPTAAPWRGSPGCRACPRSVVTGVTTGRSTGAEASSSRATVMPVATSAATSPPASAAERAPARRRSWCRLGGGCGAVADRRRGSTGRRRRAGHRGRRLGGRRRQGALAGVPSAGGAQVRGLWARWAASWLVRSARGRSVPMGPSSPRSPSVCHRGGARGLSAAFRVPGTKRAAVRRTEANPPKGRHPRWTRNTSGWPEGSARASRPPRSSPATGRGWRWPARSARLPGPAGVPRARPRSPHRPRRVGRLLRARAPPHPEAPPERRRGRR